jgi:hypothetical protein
MKPTWGVPVEEIQRGIKHGVRKINIDTDNRMALTGQIRRVLQEDPSEFDPRKYLKPAMAAMTKLSQGAFRAVRHCRSCRLDPPDPAFGHGKALSRWFAGPEVQLNLC